MLKWTFIAAVFLLVFGSCDNDFDIAADWKDIPIVYGILSPQDTAHYIRIEKAFLDENTAATAIAKIPDSVYYSDLDAALIDLGANERYQLEEVNGMEEGYVRDEGVFVTDPNILYKIRASDIQLTPGTTYRLEINRSENLPLVTADIEQVAAAQIRRPAPGQELRFIYDRDFSVLWQESDNSAFYDVTLGIRYSEWEASDPDVKDSLNLDWSLGRNITLNEASVLGIEFYEFLADQLEADPTIRRRLIAIDCFVRSGGDELLEFRTIQLANTGITGAGGELPEYTNISGGLGLITSSNLDVVDNLSLNAESLDSLRTGSITGDLNFQ